MNKLLPRITVITPSYNQAEFLERTIVSILNQGYPNLEFIIIDGGSTDGSVDVIKGYANQLTYWVSEPDNGQSHAINKGLQIATGDWVCWQNSDDIFYPLAFMRLSQSIQQNPTLDLVIGDINLIDKDDHLIRPQCYVKPTYGALVAEGMVMTNQAAFWRRNLHEEIGFLDESLHYGFDYEWFLRLLKHTNRSHHIPKKLGALRYHDQTKTSLNQTSFSSEYAKILEGLFQPGYLRYLYKLRRLLLTMLNGQVGYVFNGFKARIRSKLISKNEIF
ncbi:glycosyltransferase family 2 protein [Candidatus Methylopumilus turicensis]|uniref:Glycosyltransferases involved in cell wall biogenesis-like protein n=1 Tax=Candidatus Methylopumilus turicensis TaxID=1581680 RepID=A0A0B7IY09_9PROT|nr:glycosyltransferase family 2 protein [Candidatus Methylopumilus turicensis]CEN55993.1 Glycosyltransferases involved in cell wall biogenesis-like protein [Candidatus Methylopumilus turicensis]